MAEKWTAADVPEQRGRLAVVTGANTGLGFETAKVLAVRGAAVVLAVRDVEKGRQAAARIVEAAPEADVTVQRLDLTSLASVRAAADELRERYARIDLLINNAGIMYVPRQYTADGFELHLGTNHLGHFALTGLLLERVLAAPGSRVVAVSSLAHKTRAAIRFDDLKGERSYDRGHRYGQSKLANLMFTYELQRRLAGTDTIAVAAHPGFAATDLIRNWPGILKPLGSALMPLFSHSPAQGALSTLRAATDPAVQGGQYYGPDGIGEVVGHPKLVRSTRQSHDEAAQRRLWAVSEELTGVRFPV